MKMRVFRIVAGLFVVVGLVIGGMYLRAQPVWSAIAKVEGMGGHVFFRDECDANGILKYGPFVYADGTGPASESGWKRSLHRRFFPDVVAVRLPSTTITDADLTHLAKFQGLVRLNLVNTSVSDAGLRHLHSLVNLRMIELHDTQVTEAGFKQLQAVIPELRTDLNFDMLRFQEALRQIELEHKALSGADGNPSPSEDGAP